MTAAPIFLANGKKKKSFLEVYEDVYIIKTGHVMEYLKLYAAGFSGQRCVYISDREKTLPTPKPITSVGKYKKSFYV
jgi:hypothetical protein